MYMPGRVAALIACSEVRSRLMPTLRKLPDLERLLAKVHSFSIQQASNSSVHYEDIGRARLGEFIKTLEGLQAPPASQPPENRPALTALRL